MPIRQVRLLPEHFCGKMAICTTVLPYIHKGDSMKIRPATVEDTPAMARVIVDTFLASNVGIMSEEAWQRRKQEWTYEVSAHSWQTTIEEMAQGICEFTCLLVAEDTEEDTKGDVVGLALAGPSKDKDDPDDVGEIDILYVREDKQRQGFGRALAQAAAVEMAAAGMTQLRICTPAANTQGRRFYDKLGGRVIGTRDDYEEGELILLVVYAWDDMHAFAGLDTPATLPPATLPPVSLPEV
jgi:ribosomal protein S18 acetylase RimI-like enzyme